MWNYWCMKLIETLRKKQIFCRRASGFNRTIQLFSIFEMCGLFQEWKKVISEQCVCRWCCSSFSITEFLLDRTAHEATLSTVKKENSCIARVYNFLFDVNKIRNQTTEAGFKISFVIAIFNSGIFKLFSNIWSFFLLIFKAFCNFEFLPEFVELFLKSREMRWVQVKWILTLIHLVRNFTNYDFWIIIVIFTATLIGDIAKVKHQSRLLLLNPKRWWTQIHFNPFTIWLFIEHYNFGWNIFSLNFNFNLKNLLNLLDNILVSQTIIPHQRKTDPFVFNSDWRLQVSVK